MIFGHQIVDLAYLCDKTFRQDKEKKLTNLLPTYFIGDIHGRRDRLEALLEGIELHAASRKIEPRVYFLGDITDRGPESCQALELVYQALQKWDGSVLHLGNHDEWALDVMMKGNDSPDVDNWVLNGGMDTIKSYCGGKIDPEFPAIVREKYPHHIRMLRDAVMYREIGQFISAHAGMMPTQSLEDQNPSYFNWIRDPFLKFKEPAMRPVIHGHTILSEKPIVTENRISIDTGAYHTGKLTSCYIDHASREFSFLQASAGGVKEILPTMEDRGFGTVYDRLDDLFTNTEPKPQWT